MPNLAQGLLFEMVQKGSGKVYDCQKNLAKRAGERKSPALLFLVDQ